MCSYVVISAGCNFDVTVGSAPSINRKMVLVKWIQDQIMNTFRYGIGKSKKLSHPTDPTPTSVKGVYA